MQTSVAESTVRDHERRVIATYEAQGRRHFNPTERSRFLNIGYWRERPATLDEAAEAMVRLVAEAGAFGGRDRVLDVGCGYGDAAMLWCAEFGVPHVVGLDINAGEVEAARQRVVEHGLGGRIDLHVGSAVQMPFPEQTFDKVVAVEAAHHFLTRERFFHESARVLKPGGRLVLADVVPLPGKRFLPFFNPRNTYARDEYARKLVGAGFVDLAITSIRDHVFRPYSNFIRRQLRPIDLKAWMNVGLHRLVSTQLDYLLVTATRARR